MLFLNSRLLSSFSGGIYNVQGRAKMFPPYIHVASLYPWNFLNLWPYSWSSWPSSLGLQLQPRLAEPPAPVGLPLWVLSRLSWSAASASWSWRISSCGHYSGSSPMSALGLQLSLPHQWFDRTSWTSWIPLDCNRGSMLSPPWLHSSHSLTWPWD